MRRLIANVLPGLAGSALAATGPRASDGTAAGQISERLRVGAPRAGCMLLNRSQPRLRSRHKNAALQGHRVADGAHTDLISIPDEGARLGMDQTLCRGQNVEG